MMFLGGICGWIYGVDAENKCLEELN